MSRFLLVFFLLSQPVSALTVKEKIVQLVPSINEATASEYAEIIIKESKKSKVDPMIVVAIIKQESSFRLVATTRMKIDDQYFAAIPHANPNPLVVKNHKKDLFRQASVVKEHYFDIGLMQVNYRTAEQFNFDLEKLLVDPRYQIESGIKVLSSKINMCQHRSFPWACYHSATEQYFNIYVADVSRWN